MLNLNAEREDQNAERICRYHGSRLHCECLTYMLRNGWHPRATVASRTAGCMTRQEPCPDQKDDEEKCKYPEAKARWPWPVFRRGAAEQQSGGEADCLRA